MAEAIVNAGGRAVVISNGGFFENRLTQVGAEHIKVPVHSKNPFRILLNIRRIRKLFKSIKPDLVHIRSRAPAWSALKVAKRRKIPVVTTIHGRFQATSSFKKTYNEIMVQSDHIIATSKYIEGVVKAQFPQVSRKMSVIHRGVDTDQFNPMAISHQRLVYTAEQLGIPDVTPVILAPSRPTAWKGMSVLIEAMGKLKNSNFLLLLGGAADGTREFQDDLIKKIENAGIMDKARLTASIGDMPAAMMLADVVVMPSITPEPFGRVAVEASAMGCPVVAFNHGGAKESIRDGVTGWLAKPVDSQSLAQGISSALRLDDSERHRLSVKGRERVEAKFSSRLMCKSTIDIYLSLI
jgi:glycosyltransferase involved in cell wall biosynthesis